MGSGKSTIGRLLSEKLKMKFIETDLLIEKRAGKSVAAIFSDSGEQGFRKIESEVIEAASRENGAVISCGGGAVLNPTNMQHLKENALVIYLHVEPAVCLQRVKLEGQPVRPLLETANPEETINDIMKIRRPLYEQAADVIIKTSDLPAEEVADNIILELSANESFGLQK